MTRTTAQDLILQYMQGWKQNNLELITSCLNENCVIIESHGPRYNGIKQVEVWFQLWLKANSHITHWDAVSFHYCSEDNTAFIEWDFACISNNTNYTLPGISVVRYQNDKMILIHEYRMTQPTYIWQGKTLQSE